MPIVLDCSVAAAWAFDDERTDWTRHALEFVTRQGAIVPSLFWFELRNILIVNERRGRIDRSQTDRFLTDVESLTVIDSRPVESDVLDFARAHGLTVYDASYLELAHRLNLHICTLDRQIIEAAPKVGATIWRP